ncbi:MAG: hydroxyacylglutathione hydrolase [Neisseriaceae bacterium]|nr:MAG: hydroxyacylglutathione hydrolase [Neisseriaceae bacterium]
MKITALPAPKYHLNNYIWILELEDNVVCIDPTQEDIVLEYTKRNNLSIQHFWITHGHQDHLAGLAGLLSHFPQTEVRGSPLVLLTNQPVRDGDTFLIGENKVEVWETRGHKRDHVIFILKLDRLHIFCGDILFSAGCGRVLDGTIQELYESICRINTLPENSLFYPAHEYTQHNLEFAKYVEPSNEVVKSTLLHIQNNPHITLPVTLKHERQVNPFLRVQEPEIIQRVRKQIPNVDNTPLGIFSGLRTLRNQF